MNPRIPHHKVVIVAHASIISESEVSITVLCLLWSTRYTAVQIKNCSKSMSVITGATMKNTMVVRAPHIVWNWSIHCPSLSAMFDSLHSSTNQELFEKHVCNHRSHYEKYDGGVRPTYCLKLKYLLPLFISYVWLVTQQYESRSVQKVPMQ